MGELFMKKPDGEAITIQVDGTVIHEMQRIEIDWCDKCEKWQRLEGGHYLQSDGLAMIWLCKDCK